jgi:hypothetical protein
MNAQLLARSVGRWSAVGVGMAVASYATYVGLTWFRYGRVPPTATGKESDPLLDRFMPTCEVLERHQVRIRAPAEMTLAAASEMDLRRSPIVRAIFKGREWLMGSQPGRDLEPQAFVPQMLAIGWGMLGTIPGREIVMGAVTQPWKADVVFRPLPPDAFATFDEPDHVKIVWTLRADPVGAAESIFRTETRVATTSPSARLKFRRYWSLLSPGIVLIRRVSLGMVKADAERRARDGSPSPTLAHRGNVFEEAAPDIR